MKWQQVSNPSQMKIPIPTYTTVTHHPPASANAFTNTNLTKLANLLKPTPIPLKPKVYAGFSQGKDDKVRDILYCYSRGWTRNLEHDSKNCTRRVDGHKEETTLQNKMGGYDGQIKYRKNPSRN